MKRTIKKIIEAFLTGIACLSFILMCAERPDGSICLPWTLVWLAALVVSSVLLDRMGAFKRQEGRS